MGQRILQLLVLIFIQFLVTSSQNTDYVALQALKRVWQNTPPNWVGTDPCGDAWDGIGCTGSRLTSITLSTMQLTGDLSADIGQLTELQTLDLSYNPGLTGSLTPAIGNLKKLTNLILVGCGFTGPIPDSIGSLTGLTFLSLNSNGFTGSIPPSIGNLLNLYWLDLADNKLTGTIPVSNGSTPGLDLLVNTKHFHFGKNQLSGEINPQLFSSNMTLIHLLFENNQFTGTIPSTIGLVSHLEVLRLDRNLFSGAVPGTINNLVNVNELYLSNNRLSGSLPNLTGMSLLNYLDMSNNSFAPSVVPTWFTTLQSLTTLKMQNTNLRGELPDQLFSIPQLQTVVLRNNQLNGTLDIGTTPSTQLQLVDMQANLISGFVQGRVYTADLILIGNPICTEGGTERFCSPPTRNNSSYFTPPNNCLPTPCSSDQTPSPNCRCAYPFSGTLKFRAPSFSDLGNSSIYTTLHNSLMVKFTNLSLPVDSVSVSRPTKNLDDYLVLNLDVFPSVQDRFNRSGISRIGFVLSNQTWKPPHTFGPYFFIAENYDFLADNSANKKSSSSTGVIIGAVAGGCVLVLLLILAGSYAFRQKGRAKRADKRNSPFALWDTNKGSGGIPQLKGARNFSCDELKKYTHNFSDNIGAGGYGMVYRGTLPSGQMVAIKRAQQGSTQGGLEFKTEIELLSRVHHKNVVSLVGFCFDEGEQMLIYEYIANGTLKDSLSGRTGIKLDWMRRLRLTLGTARGLQYLHDLADPPIIHRDIKSNNILLDERLNAKVADFGLSKPKGDPDRTHITTQVKGTMGYMDPEYYMTQQLTEKSDVYSFGVVMLELITARSPIEKGKYIVREVKQTMDKSKPLYNLQEVIDPTIGSSMELKGLENYVDLALRCVEESGSQRPTMGEVVKEIENIMESAGFNPNAESATTSASYSEGGKGHEHPYNTNDSLFAYSGAYPPSSLEPK